MAKASRPKPSKPRLWRYTNMYAAIRDLQDQMIAGRGGKKFVPRPDIPGDVERWRRKDTALQATVARLCGKD